MLTKERTGKTRKLKFAAVALALLAVLVFCFASCGKATPVGIKYVADSATKVDYNVGDTFDCTGAKIEVTYSNGTTAKVDVTSEMVGNAPLTLGTESVSVTYSEDGVTVVGYIPVTVSDPYTAEKEAAIAEINKADNNIDKGIVILIRDYTAKINAATSADAINTVKANFNDALDAYLDAKEAILAAFDTDADLKAKVENLEANYPQFAQDIKTEKKNAIANINAASTVAEAEAYFAAFKVAVDNKIAETEDYEEEDAGLIDKKIAILELIEKYEARIALLEDIIRENAAEITNPVDYTQTKKDLAYWTKYVTLAISLSGIEDKINKEIGEDLRTDIDDAADIIKGGVVVFPTSYNKDEAGEYITETQDWIDSVKAELAAAVTAFGAKGAEALKAEYGMFDKNVSMIDKIIADVEANLAWVNAIRTDAMKVISAIDAAKADPTDAKVATAWAELNKWATATGKEVLTMNLDAVAVLDRVVYGTKNFANVVFTADFADGKFASAGNWAAYEENLDKDYVVEYFVPNIDDIFTAAEKADENKIIAMVLPEKIIYAKDLTVDSNAAIAAVEKAIADFKAAYYTDAEGNFDAEGYAALTKVVALEDAAKEARKHYDETLKVLAKKANDALDAFKASLVIDENGTVRDVVIGDYVPVDAELTVSLQGAYEAYLAFASVNYYYTDVIENEADLIAYMETYVALAYKEQKEVQTELIVNKAYTEVLDGTDADKDTDFRAALTAKKNEVIKTVLENNSYDKTGTTKFNFIEILTKNLDAAEDAAIAAAKIVTDFKL